jgi:hypothetical protein
MTLEGRLMRLTFQNPPRVIAAMTGPRLRISVDIFMKKPEPPRIDLASFFEQDAIDVQLSLIRVSTRSVSFISPPVFPLRQR